MRSSGRIYQRARLSLIGLALALASCGSGDRVDWMSVRDDLNDVMTAELLVGEWESSHVFTLTIDENKRYEICSTARGFGAVCSGGYVEFRNGLRVILLNFTEMDVGKRILHMTQEINSPRTRRDLWGADVPRGAIDFSPNVAGDQLEECQYNPCTLLGRPGGERLLFRFKEAGRFNQDLKQRVSGTAENSTSG